MIFNKKDIYYIQLFEIRISPMPQFTTQFAIINKIKSIVKKTGGLFTPSNNGITTAIARKIQRTSYEVTKRQEKDSFTPPYLWIAEELQSNDAQIFKASVYYLANIAINEPRYTDAILDILGKNIDSVKNDKDKIDYIKEKIDYIGTNRRK